MQVYFLIRFDASLLFAQVRPMFGDFPGEQVRETENREVLKGPG
jgi:hypothetical protein